METPEVKNIRTAEEYIKDFHMDDKDQRRFDHREFLIAFGKEFSLWVTVNTDKGIIKYEDFRDVVHNLYNKFLEIRKIREKHKNLSDNLWKAFYAMYVVTRRGELFPAIQEKIDEKRRSNK